MRSGSLLTRRKTLRDMASKIAIVGGGHVGSVLGLALLSEGHDVTILTSLTLEELRLGRILSSQCIWGTAAAIEERWAPFFWKPDYAGIGGFRIRMVDKDSQDVESDIATELEANGNSVDQRLKISGWLGKFEHQGGELRFGQLSQADLEEVSERFDLVIVCAGKFRGDLGELFPRDPHRSRHDKPQRIGSVVSIHGRKQELSHGTYAAFEEWSVIPGIGDFFAIPAYSEAGPCHVVCMEGFLGGPLDKFEGVRDPADILRLTRDIFERWLPWERGRWDDVRLTDKGGAICGGFAPSVRRAVATLPNNKSVLAFGDAYILLDPLTAQGANMHLKNIPLLLERIATACGHFTRDWMEQTADLIWERSKRTEAVLEQYLNPAPYLWDIFRAAHRSRSFSRWWVNAHFDRPTDLLPWIEDAGATSSFLGQHA
jgi:2-polyprenyl-6-methoxyphenol hydroxylase-like FAD-dependent oxidoreductase